MTGQTVCAHAGFGPIRVAQSTGSMVSHVTADDITVAHRHLGTVHVGVQTDLVRRWAT